MNRHINCSTIRLYIVSNYLITTLCWNNSFFQLVRHKRTHVFKHIFSRRRDIKKYFLCQSYGMVKKCFLMTSYQLRTNVLSFLNDLHAWCIKFKWVVLLWCFFTQKVDNVKFTKCKCNIAITFFEPVQLYHIKHSVFNFTKPLVFINLSWNKNKYSQSI